MLSRAQQLLSSCGTNSLSPGALWVALVRAGTSELAPPSSHQGSAPPQGCSSSPSSPSSLVHQQYSHDASSSSSSSLLSPFSSSHLHLFHPWDQLQQVRTATKKAGGTARQRPDTKSRNLGVKLTHNEVIFPGQIMVRQRGTKYHPGYNVGLGKDHTIFATSVGRVHFSKETVQYMGGRTKDRTVVSVVPLNGDWSPAYKELEAIAIERRATLKRKLLKAHAHEAALFFPLPGPRPTLDIPLPSASSKIEAAQKPPALHPPSKSASQQAKVQASQ